MNARKCTNGGILLIFFIFLCAGPLAAQMNQMNSIYRFRGVAIPVDLRIEETVYPRGEYDLEFLKVPVSMSYFMRIMKEGKILQLVQGTLFPYERKSKQVPWNPTLKMARNTGEKKLVITFESGAGTRNYARIRANFFIDYVGD
jgi:hypothetical protein